MEIVIAREEPGRRLPTIHRFEKDQLLAGRGWHCDLVLVDEEIDSEHARICFDPESGEFLLQDLNSRNGIRVENRPVNSSQRVTFGQPITLGQTTFTVHRASDKVAPAIAHSNAERFLTRVSKPATALLLAAFAIVVASLDDFLSGVGKFSWEAWMNAALTLGAGMILIALVGGGIAKLFKHKMRGWAHLWVLASFAIVTTIAGFLQRFIAFNLLNPSFAHGLDRAVDAMLVALWVGAALVISTNIKPRARNAIVLFVALGLVSITWVLPKLQQQDWSGAPELQTTTLPPAFLLRSAEPQTRLKSMVQSAMQGARENAVERKRERDKEDAEE